MNTRPDHNSIATQIRCDAIDEFRHALASHPFRQFCDAEEYGYSPAIANAFEDAERRLNAAAAESASPREATLAKLRAAATNGKRRLRLVQGGLTPGEREALTDEDWVSLNAAAEKVGA